MKNTYFIFQVLFLSVWLFHALQTLQEKVERHVEESIEAVKGEREEGFLIFNDLLSATSQEDILVRLDTTSVAEDRLWSAARALHTAITKLPKMEESCTSQPSVDTKHSGLRTKDERETSPHEFDNSDGFDDDEDEISRSATRTVSQYYGGGGSLQKSPPIASPSPSPSPVQPPPSPSPVERSSPSPAEQPPKSPAVHTQPVPESGDDDYERGVVMGIAISALLLLVVLLILVILLLCRCFINRSQNRAPYIAVPVDPASPYTQRDTLPTSTHYLMEKYN